MLERSLVRLKYMTSLLGWIVGDQGFAMAEVDL